MLEANQRKINKEKIRNNLFLNLLMAPSFELIHNECLSEPHFNIDDQFPSNVTLYT
jgi:hypothetical protein